MRKIGVFLRFGGIEDYRHHSNPVGFFHRIAPTRSRVALVAAISAQCVRPTAANPARSHGPPEQSELSWTFRGFPTSLAKVGFLSHTKPVSVFQRGILQPT